MDEILKRIPQRAPFLFIDKIIEQKEQTITSSFTWDEELKFFQGHFPSDPVVPGVLLCESVFQTGALLMSYLNEGGIADKTAVVSRIQGAKFKRIVRTNEKAHIWVSLKERMDAAAYMKGKITVDGKVALQIEFACTLV